MDDFATKPPRYRNFIFVPGIFILHFPSQSVKYINTFIFGLF